MCRECSFAAIIASFLLSVCAGACLAKDIPASGSATRHILANGLHVVIVENRRVYMDLGAGDVLPTFARWIRPGDMIDVTEGPVE